MEPQPTAGVVLHAVLFNKEQLRAFAAWLERQTFPYDELAVAQAAKAVWSRAVQLKD